MSPSLIRKIRYAVSVLTIGTLGVVVWSYWKRSELTTLPPPAVQLLEAEVLESIEGVEYVETEGENVVFKIVADKYVRTRDGKNLLEGTRAINFGKDGSRNDSIESQYCQYDPEAQGVAFQGKVVIRTHEGAEIVTESLTYTKHSEIAQTDDRFSFSYGNFVGEGKGFAYHFREELIYILDEVQFGLDAKSEEQGHWVSRPISIKSRTATFYGDYSFEFIGSATIQQNETRLTAHQIQIKLDDQGKLIKTLGARDGAQLDFLSAGGTSQLGGRSLFLRFAPETNALQSMKAENQAYLKIQEENQSITHLTASVIDLDVDAAGLPTKLRASNDAEFARSLGRGRLWVQGGGLAIWFFPNRPNPQVLSFGKPSRLRMLQQEMLLELWTARLEIKFLATSSTNGLKNILAQGGSILRSTNLEAPIQEAWALRDLDPHYAHTFRSERLSVDFDSMGLHPRRARGTGQCFLESRLDPGSKEDKRTVQAPSFLLEFFAGTSTPQKLAAGTGVQILLEQKGGLRRQTHSDEVEAEFDRQTGDIIALQQTGKFQFEQHDLHATSRQARWMNRTGLMELRGSPHLWDGRMDLKATVLEVTHNGDIVAAKDNVRNIFKTNGHDGPGGETFRLAGKPSDLSNPNPILITCDRLSLDRKRQLATYDGAVKVSQGQRSIAADSVQLNQVEESLIADGNVETYFVGSTNAEGKGSSFHAISDHMSLIRNNRNMEFLYNVTVTADDLKLEASKLVIDFDAPLENVHKMSAFGDVYMTKGGWYGAGDAAEFRAIEQLLILTGHLGEIWDQSNRRSRGHRLTIHFPDDRISVESRP